MNEKANDMSNPSWLNVWLKLILVKSIRLERRTRRDKSGANYGLPQRAAGERSPAWWRTLAGRVRHTCGPPSLARSQGYYLNYGGRTRGFLEI